MYFKVQALVDLWTANGRSVVEKLKQRCLAPKQVNELYFDTRENAHHTSPIDGSNNTETLIQSRIIINKYLIINYIFAWHTLLICNEIGNKWTAKLSYKINKFDTRNLFIVAFVLK